MQDLASYGLKGFEESIELNNQIGRIIGVNKNRYKAISKTGEVIAKIKGSFYYKNEDKESFVTVGDWVILSISDNSDCYVIERIINRRSYISRSVGEKKKMEQLIAANIDYVFICVCVDNDFNLNRIERLIYSICKDNIKLVIVLTKTDLVNDIEKYVSQIKQRINNVDVITLSMFNNDYLIKFNDYLNKGITSVFIGSSGVGKSTLINALYGHNIQKTAPISVKSQRGKHTTVSRELVCSEVNGCLIDTPGIRNFGLWNNDDCCDTFENINSLAKHCKYKDCQHLNEDCCAVKKGIADGVISKQQFLNYQKLEKERLYIDDYKIHQKNQKNRIKKRELDKSSKRK